jgi:hypothetical protein
VTVTTPADIIRLVLKDTGVIGVGQTASAEDTNDLFDTMNMMIGEWASKRWLLYHLMDLSKVSTGAISYTVGPGGDIDTGTMQRPDRLEDGNFFRQLITASSPNKIDYPLALLESREDYNRIGLKQLTTIPQYIYYDAAYPLGIVYPWPVIQPSQYELHILVKAQLPQFANLADPINLPSQYYGALRYNLACRVRSMYQLSPDPTLISLATDSLSTIRNMNAQVPRLRMPAGIGRGNKYNIYSDSNY